MNATRMQNSAAEEIKSKVEIVPLISEYVQVKKTGASFMAKCPFHGEKTASLHISPDKQMWYCHGCGEGGDIFGFIMRVEGLDFLDALRFLAKKAGVTLNRDDAKANSERQKLMEINGLAAKFFHEVLLKLPAAEPGRAYAAKRALAKETLEDFQIGFSPDSWDATLTALKKKGFTDEQIFRAGLASKSDRGRGYFDRFRKRLMFPIRDVQGNTVGFTARVMPGPDGKDPKDEAKYINTTETPIYSKSRVLYGLDAARKEIKKQDLAVVVEGNMDVIASHQAGVKNVVGSSGTSFTSDQLALLKRFCSRLVLSFDNDPAGENAARRSVDAAVAAGFAVRILRLPPGAGKDPDDCINKGVTVWQQAIAGAVPFMEWYLALAKERTDMKDPDAVRSASQSLLTEIAKLQAPVERSHWIRRVAEMFDTPESVLFEEVQRLAHAAAAARKTAPVPRPAAVPYSDQAEPAVTVQPAPEASKNAPKPLQKRSRDEVVSRHLLALVFAYPELAAGITEAVRPEMFTGEDAELYRDFAVAYAQMRQRGQETHDYRQSLLRAENREIADRVAFLELLAEREYGGLEADARRGVVKGLIGELKLLHKGRRQRELAHAMSLAEQAGDTAKIQEIQAQLGELIV